MLPIIQINQIKLDRRIYASDNSQVVSSIMLCSSHGTNYKYTQDANYLKITEMLHKGNLGM